MKTFVFIFTLIIGFGLYFVSVEAKNKKTKGGEWITISGVVTGVRDDGFVILSEGKSTFIDFDSTPAHSNLQKLESGYQVIVSGEIEQIQFEEGKLLAEQIYLKETDTYLIGQPTENSNDVISLNPYYSTVEDLPQNTIVNIKGRVTRIKQRDIFVFTGDREIKVDTSEMAFNPIDDQGATKIELNDFVKVSGTVERNFFQSNAIKASFISEY